MCLLMHLIMQVYTFGAFYLKCRLSSLYRLINEISRSLDKNASLKCVVHVKLKLFFSMLFGVENI